MDFDNAVFAENLRSRFRILLKIRGRSVREVSIESGAGETSFQQFLSGRSNEPRLTSFLRWARALDIRYSLLIDGAESHDPDAGELPDNKDVDNRNTDEVHLLKTSATRLQFVMDVMQLSKSDIAEAARVFKDGEPDTKTVDHWLNADALIPPATAIRLTDALGLSVDDLYGTET